MTVAPQTRTHTTAHVHGRSCANVAYRRIIAPIDDAVRRRRDSVPTVTTVRVRLEPSHFSFASPLLFVIFVIFGTFDDL